MDAGELFSDVGAIAAYGAIGLVLMALGYAVVDLLTPGKLHELIWTQRNANASIVLAANTFAVAIIVVTAIRSSYDDLGDGLISTAVYGVVGIAIMAICFVLIDLLTPGKLGEMVTGEERHPAVWVTVSSHLSSALIVAAAIS